METTSNTDKRADPEAVDGIGNSPAAEHPVAAASPPVATPPVGSVNAGPADSSATAVDPAAATGSASSAAPAVSATPKAAGNPKRRKALGVLTLLVLAAGIGYGSYWWLVLNHFESTDNAYVQANIVQITPQQAGTVIAIGADDTAHVKAGDVLVRFDPADAQVALEQAQAQLAQSVREVRGVYANNATLQAQVATRAAESARLQAELARAQDDVARRGALVASGAVGKEEFDHVNAQLAAVRSALAAAQSAVLAARQQLATNQTQTAGVSVEKHPNVLRAAARVHEAELALARTELLAPVEGYVARRSVQLGQRVAAGTPLMAVIALDRVWVEANFKESQLQRVRIGQPATLQADVYGGKVQYHGVVEGLSAGTGAAFALLPAQNATGNWIKVVQRVPVRIRLDAKELVDHPLRVGLSMEVQVDIRNTTGRMLSDATDAPSNLQTRAYAQAATGAQARIRRLPAANAALGPATGSVQPE